MKKSLVLLILITTISNIFSQYQKIEVIDKLFKQYNENTPGCVIGVVQNGEIIFQKGYGSACLDYSIQNNSHTKFLIGSLSKQFTGACIAILITENKLKLEDDIRKYIPAFPFYGDTIKVSNLLFHTSGIKNYEIAMGMSGIGFDETYQDYNHLLDLIYNQSTLVFKPNTKYAYSNSNFTLLGEIVFRITGQKLEEFAERKIFQPLNMHHTSYWISPNEVIKNRAIGYSSLGHGEYKINQPRWIPYGSGNMISNITDLNKWCSFLMEQYQEQTEFIKVFTRMGYTSNGKPTNYASGIKLSKYRGLRKYEHGGGLHGFRSRITIFPDNDLSIIILGNIDNLWTYSATCLLADYFLKKEFSKGKDYTIPSTYQITAKCNDIITLDESSLDIFENCYELGDGYIFEIKAIETGLNIWESWSNSEYTVYPINNSSFIDSTGVVQFDFNNISNGTAKKLDVIYNGDKSTAVLDHKTPTDSLLLIELSGFYYSNDLNTVYHFFRNEETLFVRIGNEIPRKVLVMNKNLLSFSGYEAIVNRDEENKISGFELTNQKSSRNNIFVKISPHIN